MPVLIKEVANQPYEVWKAERVEYIGGSEAAAVVGINPYVSKVVVYMEKTGQYSREVNSEAATWGNILEPVLRKEFAKRINEEREAQGLPPLRVQQRKAIFAHDEHNFIRTNLDGLVYGHELGKGILEIKTANQYLSDEWAGEDVPNHYYLQVQHNIAVMNVKYAFLAVLIGGQKYKHYFIERDDELINNLIELERQFWQENVLKRIPPEMDGHDSTAEMMKALYPTHLEGTILELPYEAKLWVEKLEDIKQQENALKEAKQLTQNLIKDAMKDAPEAWAGKHKITWKTSKNGQRPLKYKLAKPEAVS
jgi:putative phage-type endonuclease